MAHAGDLFNISGDISSGLSAVDGGLPNGFSGMLFSGKCLVFSTSCCLNTVQVQSSPLKVMLSGARTASSPYSSLAG